MMPEPAAVNDVGVIERPDELVMVTSSVEEAFTSVVGKVPDENVSEPFGRATTSSAPELVMKRSPLPSTKIPAGPARSVVSCDENKSVGVSALTLAP
jgi:hypothetical protein